MTTYKSGQREQQTLEFIRTFKLERGYPPSIREIAKGIGLRSPGAVHEIVKALHARGALIWRPRQQRSIKLIPQSPVLSVELPAHLYANVQAVARKAKVTPEAVVIEAVRSGFASIRSTNVPKPVACETPKRDAA